MLRQAHVEADVGENPFWEWKNQFHNEIASNAAGPAPSDAGLFQSSATDVLLDMDGYFVPAATNAYDYHF